MRNLEDKVRNEVEVLWGKYEAIPGVTGLERSRSRSMQRDEEADKRKEAAGKFSTPASKESGSKSTKQSGHTRGVSGDKASLPVNPITASTQSATSPPGPGASSLLSASISANSFHAPPPPPKMADKVEDSIDSLSRTLGKRSDERAVAMSHVFSVLDDAMANQASHRRRESATRQKDPTEALSEDQEGSETDVNGKDSWIDAERRLMATKGDGEEADGRTPRAANRKELVEGKEKKAVKFQDPTSENEEAVEAEDEKDEDDGA